MADTKTIEVPVKLKAEFRDINKDLQKVLKNIQDGLTEVDPASGLAKNLTKAYTEFEKQLNKSQGLLNKEFFSEADMSKVTKAWDKISEVLSTIDSYVSRASLGTLGIDIDGLTEAKQKFDDITKARQAFLMQPVKADITAEALSLAQKHAGKSGFKETVNYGRNLANMTTASATLAEQLKVLEKQALDTQEALDKAALSHTAAQTNLSIAEDNKKRQEGLYNTQYSNVASAFAQAGAAANANSPQSVINAYKNTVASLVSNGAGEFTENGQLIARMIRDWFDLDIDFSKEANEIVEDLQNGLEKALKENSNNWGKRGKLNGKALQNAFTPFSQKAGKDNFSASKTSKELTAAVIEAQEEVDKTKAAIDDTSEGSLNSVKMALDAQITEAKTVINEINAAIEELKQLRNKRGEQAEAIFGDQQRDARQEILDLENQARLNTQYRKNVGEGQRLTHQGTVEADAVVTDRKAAERERKEQEERIKRENDQRIAAEKAAQDSEEQFRQRLTQSIHQWTSVQQIVNKIKDGFRQAIQDIKGLDQAMTNIAVVTDMSVSDLWGKIDEYMSIAQQYGVTTQGVYEVSQLYYQQGLGTEEVMAATTETLKMARIAGMEYAEAADAMTVAIRAFKMEMSDAEHVTDVYSKVAAVTASDTEELAVAMSKTASSAESVGSSFENTTAMLAVMIETTRESAQNLGSALKSIISRYGEMKVGVTVDSEGETIDYNKVDTALKSVGISIKDAQGQFRDFDDVIFELSEKWDSLDKNTQRYIATIMAGNRQQSRFIALVDNWERLDEVAGAAQDSEDAGLLQYAKTLDSLESKVNNIKTSFQQFYMSVFNGPVVGAALEFLNNLIKGFNKLSKLTTIFNAVSIISGIRIVGELVVNTFSGAFKNISTAWKTTLKEMRLGAAKEARATGRDYQNNMEAGMKEADDPDIDNDAAVTKTGRRNALISAGLSAAGMGLSAWGSSAAASNQTTGALLSGAGNGLSAAGLVMSLGAAIPGIGWAAAAVGGITAVVSAITSMPSALEKAQEDLAKAEEKAEKSNIERAEKKNEYETLKDGLEELERLKASRHDSAEAEQKFISANNALLEQFPQLATTFEGAENAIIDLQEAEKDLMRARVQASIAAKESADAEIARALKEQAVKKQQAKDAQQGIANIAGQTYTSYSHRGTVTVTADDKGVEGTQTAFLGNGIFTADQLQKAGFALAPSNSPEIIKQIKNTGNMAYGLKKGNGKYSIHTFNKYLAEAASYLDLEGNEEALKWFGKLAKIADDAEMAQIVGQTFNTGYLKEGKTETDFIEALTNNKYKTAGALAAVTPTAEREVKFAGAALDNAIKAGIADYINSSIIFLEEENSFLGMSNSKKVLQQKLESSFAEYRDKNKDADPEELWKTWTEASDGYNQVYTKWSEQLDAAYKDLKAFSSLEEYNELDKNRGRYTADEYKNALDEFKSLIGEELYTFLTDSVDAAATQAQTDFSEAISSINKQDFVNFDITGFTLPEEYYDEAVDYAKSLNAQVKGGRLHKDTAWQQWENYKKIWAEIDGLADPNQKLAARQKVSQADLSSITSIRQLEADLAESGITLGSDIWTSLIKNAAVNLVTEVETLQSSIATQLDASAKAIKNAYNGVDSAAEALKMANKFGVDLADLDVRNGKFYFEDAEVIKKATQKEWEQTVKDLLGDDSSWWQDEESAFGRAYQDAGDISDYAALEAKQKELLDKQTKNAAAMKQDELDQLALFNQYGDQYKEWASKQSPGTATSFRDFITYVRDTSDAALVTMHEKWQAQIEKEAAKQSTIDSFYGGEAERKKLSAQKSLASGDQGLSGDTIYDILDAYGFDPEKDWQTYFTKNADGTFDIVKDTELFNKLDQVTKNAIVASIEKKAQAAEEGLTKLAESAAKKETLTPSEIRAALGESAASFSDEMANAYYRLFTDAVADGTLEDNDALRKDVRTHFENLGYKDGELDNAVNGFFAIFGDAITDTSAKILELKGKALRGELTETERQTLTEKGIDPQIIKDLENRTQEAISNYVNEIISNTELDFDAKVSTLKKDVFTPKLKEKFGEDIRGLAETAVKGSFNTQEAAADFLSQFYVAMGGAISDTKLDDWIEEGTTGYTLDYEAMSEAIEARKAEINNQSNLTASNYEVQKALNDEWDRLNSFQDDLNYYSSIQAQQRKESLYPALQSMAADKNITASQLMDLFKNQDKEITLEEAQTYQQELETLNPLARLKKLREYLEKKKVTIDESEYKEIVKETYASVMSSVSGAIGKLGSGMSWDDTFGLIEEVEGLDFEDFDLINGQYFIKNISKVTDHYLNQLKEIYGNEIPANVQEEAQAVIEQLKKQAEKDLEIAKYAAQWGEALEEGGIEQTKTEGLDLLKSKGYKGYTDQDMATLQAAGLIKTDAASLEKIQSQIDEETGAFYLTPEDLQPVTAATRNALKLTLDQEVQSAKTAAENLATKMASGTAEFGDYEALFKESITPENFDIIEPLLKQYVEDQSNATDVKNALKRAYPKTEEEDIDAILANWVAFYNDAKHETARSIFDTKIEALSSGYLSEASKETLKKGGASDFVTKFAGLAGEAADKIFNAVYEEYEKAYDAGDIKRDEYRTGIAEAASKAFTAKVEAKKPSLYLDDATKEIAGGDALYDADALGSLYAAIADKQKAAKETVDDFDTFYEKYVTGITEAGEAILNVKALKGANLISDRRYKEFSSALMDNLFSSAEEIITQMETGDTEGLGLQIQQMFDALGMSLSDTDAAAILNGGKDVLLNRLILEINRAGLDTSEVQSRLQELQALILDAITESISSGLSALGEGIEGTLSEASFLDLQNKYKFEDSSFRTSRGIQLSAQNRQDIISGLYGEAKANGRTAGFGEQLLEILNTEGSGFEGYKDIEEAIADANEQIANGVEGAEEYAEALILARDAAYEMADAAEFAFMEQDGYDGKADTFDKFTENVTKAKEALTTFKKGGKVAHADLTAMFDVIKSGSEESIAKFETSLSKAGGNMEEILHSMLNFVDTTGKIDLSKWATKMGIDIETATSAMSEGMSDALMTTAKDQIKYLSGLEAMLKAMVALEEIGNIDLSLSFIGDDGQVINLQLSEILETWDKLSQTEQIELQTVIEQKFVGPNGIDYTAGAKNLTEALGFKGSLSTLLFGKEGIDGKQDLAIADAFGTFAKNIRNMSEGEIETVALKMRAAMKDFMIFDDEGNVTAWKEGYEGAFQKFLSSFDFTNIAESLNSKLSEALATKGGKITIPFKEGDLVIESAGADGLKITGPGGKMLTELSETQITAVKESLAKQLGMAVEDIEIDTKTGLVNFYGETAKAETEAIKTEFQSLEEAAASVAEQTNFLQQTIATFEVSEGFREFVGLLNQITGGTQVAAETVEGAAQLANLGKEINAEGEGNGLQLKVDISEAINEFEKLQTKFEALVEVLSAPITIDIKSVGTITAGAPVVEAQSGNAQKNGTNTGVNTITTHTVQILWEVTDPDFDSIEDPTLGFNWKEPAPPVPAPAKTPTISFYWATNSTPPKYTGKPVEIPTVLKPLTSGGTSSSNGGTQQIIKEWTGTINNISGTAFADGSIGRLYSGAQFANKTLVGELGPELAVYNGEYHLLGQSGAEFVRLPNNAIVFNHKQTEGIVNGQANIRGKAMADGNVSGPALAGGSAAAALEAVRRAKSLWQGLLDDLTAAQLAGGSSGGGGGNTLKGVKEELQEWYNLSRQIAEIEQEINNLIAERQNIAKKDGDAYLRSLRKEQELLERQAATQEILLGYQQLQLERQAEQINTNKIWSQFLEVDESGLLQYIKGNELNGGKGALEVLSELNEMSGEEQLKFLNNLGYTAVDQDGEKLEGQELIQKFFEELQLQIDEYDALYDTVHETEETLEDLQHKVEEINNQIIENQMDLEEDIFNILVDAWEAEIEALEEQKDLIEEANEAYIKGLNEALSAEREMYSEEQSIADREQLQRQLSLLRRSGGSASQIADLEQQLDSMLKDEYFRNQEQVIERIEDANEEQIRQLEHQIRLQEEALEFEKEHGILWTKVYDIMAGSADQILNFMQGNSLEFFRQSALAQKDMLDEWSKKIGIFTENREYEKHQTDSQTNVWNNGAIWNESGMSEYKQIFDSLTPEQQTKVQSLFNSTYSNARLAGDDHTTAMAKAKSTLINTLKSQKEQQAASGNKPETDLNTGSGSEIWYVTGPNKLNLRDQPSKSGNRLAQLSAGTKVKVIKKLSNGWFQVEVDGKTGYVDSQFLSKGTSSSSSSGSSSSSSSSSNGSSSSSSSSSSGQQYKANYTITYQSQSTGDVRTYTGTGIGNTEAAAINAANAWLRRRQNGERPSAFPASEWDEMSARAATKAYAYAQGGLVDYTGIAMVHGSSSKPEAFLNAKQTAMISEAVKVAGDGGALDGIRTTLNKLDATIKSIVNNNKNETTSFTVAPGAVTIQVAQLNDSYDVEELSKDVMNRMVAIASKSTNRGVNRR